MATLAHGETEILADPLCEDVRAALDVARGLGVEVRRTENGILLRPGATPAKKYLHCGEAGLSIRMFVSLAALQASPITVTASGPLQTRPMDMLVAPLRDLGVEISTNYGRAPIRLKGPMIGGYCRLDGSQTSQFLTGLLIALPLCPQDSVIDVTNLKSLPYVKLTLSLLEKFGIHIDHDPDFRVFRIPGKQHYRGNALRIEGDWSGASFPLVAGAIAGSVFVRGLRRDSEQADRIVLEVLKACGAEIDWTDENICRVAKRSLKAFRFDAEHCPDLFPPLVALASFCEGTSELYGVSRLRHKESDRAEALKAEFGKLGIGVTLHGESMRVEGGFVRGGRVDSHQDHRIAMACAVAGLAAENAVEIEGDECVTKSYPKFFEDLLTIGANVT